MIDLNLQVAQRPMTADAVTPEGRAFLARFGFVAVGDGEAGALRMRLEGGR